uniref:Uncharacterized protein n=1 Tax=Proboscia inermis TaxID=420281 RepID=A0A7S0BUY2_9STRA
MHVLQGGNNGGRRSHSKGRDRNQYAIRPESDITHENLSQRETTKTNRNGNGSSYAGSVFDDDDIADLLSNHSGNVGRSIGDAFSDGDASLELTELELNAIHSR